MKKKIIIELGSNENPSDNIRLAKKKLSLFFPGIEFTRSLSTAPIGMKSRNFVNALAYVYINEGDEEVAGQESSVIRNVEDVLRKLKGIERELGRSPSDKARNMVKIDLDLLQYGDVILKKEDWQRPFVLQLMKEIGE